MKKNWAQCIVLSAIIFQCMTTVMMPSFHQPPTRRLFYNENNHHQSLSPEVAQQVQERQQTDNTLEHACWKAAFESIEHDDSKTFQALLNLYVFNPNAIYTVTNEVHYYGHTLLTYAVMLNRVNHIYILVKNSKVPCKEWRTNVNQQSLYKYSPLALSYTNHNEEIFNLLQLCGAQEDASYFAALTLF